MNDTTQQPKNLLMRLAQSKTITRFLTQVNVVLYRLSNGKAANKVKGRPICLVTMTGRKSGKRKTIALMYTEHDGDVLLVASLGGSPKNPVWYYNLKAQPNIAIQIGGRKRELIAREAGIDERAEVWPLAVASYPDFAVYQQKTARLIPVFICSPK